MINLNPGFHMIATIAVIAAIAEKKKSDPSDQYIAIIWNHKHSPAIAATTIADDRCRCDRWRVVSIWSLNFFFLAIAAITAIVAIIFTFPFLFFTVLIFTSPFCFLVENSVFIFYLSFSVFNVLIFTSPFCFSVEMSVFIILLFYFCF